MANLAHRSKRLVKRLFLLLGIPLLLGHFRITTAQGEVDINDVAGFLVFIKEIFHDLDRLGILTRTSQCLPKTQTSGLP